MRAVASFHPVDLWDNMGQLGQRIIFPEGCWGVVCNRERSDEGAILFVRGFPSPTYSSSTQIVAQLKYLHSK